MFMQIKKEEETKQAEPCRLDTDPFWKHENEQEQILVVTGHLTRFFILLQRKRIVQLYPIIHVEHLRR